MTWLVRSLTACVVMAGLSLAVIAFNSLAWTYAELLPFRRSLTRRPVNH